MNDGYLSSTQDTEKRLLNLRLPIWIYDNQHESITDAFLSKYPIKNYVIKKPLNFWVMFYKFFNIGINSITYGKRQWAFLINSVIPDYERIFHHFLVA